MDPRLKRWCAIPRPMPRPRDAAAGQLLAASDSIWSLAPSHAPRDHVRVSLTGRLDRLGVARSKGHYERFKTKMCTWHGEGLMTGCSIGEMLGIAFKQACCRKRVRRLGPSVIPSFLQFIYTQTQQSRLNTISSIMKSLNCGSSVPNSELPTPTLSAWSRNPSRCVVSLILAVFYKTYPTSVCRTAMATITATGATRPHLVHQNCGTDHPS